MNLFLDQAFVWSKWEVLFLYRVKSSFFSGLSNKLNSYYRGIQYTQVKLDVRLVFCVHLHHPLMVNEPQNTHPRSRPRGSQLQGRNWKRREDKFSRFFARAWRISSRLFPTQLTTPGSTPRMPNTLLDHHLTAWGMLCFSKVLIAICQTRTALCCFSAAGLILTSIALNCGVQTTESSR